MIATVSFIHSHLSPFCLLWPFIAPAPSTRAVNDAEDELTLRTTANALYAFRVAVMEQAGGAKAVLNVTKADEQVWVGARVLEILRQVRLGARARARV